MPPGVGFYLVFVGPGVGGFELFFPGVGNLPIKRIARGFCPGGWSGLELTDTLQKNVL